MNVLNFQSWPIRTKLVVTLAIAVLVPLIMVMAFSINGANQVNLENVKAFVAETNRFKQSRISRDFQTALTDINAFVEDSNHFQVILAPLNIRNTQGTSSQSTIIESVTQDLFRRELLNLPSRLYSGVWLLTNRGFVVTGAAAPGYSLPFSLNVRTARDVEVYELGLQLSRQRRNTQTLVVTTRNGEPSFEIIQVLRTGAEVDGYLIVQLNLETIITSKLAPDAGSLQTYSYAVIPALNELIALNEVVVDGLVSMDYESIGLQRAINRSSSSLDVYQTGPSNDRREVIGHYAPIIVGNNRLAILTEISTSIINNQLFNYGSSILFVLVLGTIALISVLTLFLNQSLTSPVQLLSNAVRGMARGNYDTPLELEGRTDELGQLAHDFSDMRIQVNELLEDLRRRLEARNRDVRVTQNISRAAAGERDLQVLMDRVVNLIVENFPTIYHAQIFLLDTNHEYAVLRSSTGELGKQLLARGHRLEVGSVSVIGQVTEQGQLVVARDTAFSNVHRQNEFLSDTLAELAIPLKLGDEIMGALDVQSKYRDSFDEDQVQALQALADQITVAIANTRLYEESQRLVQGLQTQRRDETVRSWQNFMSSQRSNILTRSAGANTEYDFTVLRNAVLKSGKSIVGEITPRDTVPFAVPVRLRGELLGVVEYEVPQSDFRYDKVLLAEELVDRLAISLDNARLFQESQKAAERERVVNDISTRITGQTDIQEIIRTAIHEVSQALRTPQVAIRLMSGNDEVKINGNSNSTHVNGNGTNGHHDPTDLS